MRNLKQVKKLYFESYLFYLITILSDKLIPAVKKSFSNSFIYSLWIWFDEKVINSKPIKLIFDTEYISSLWYKSFFYRYTMFRIRKASFYIPKSTYKFKNIYIGFFIAFILFLPDVLWSELIWVPLFITLIVLYLSRNIRNRAGTVMAMVNIILIFFMTMVEFALPYRGVKYFIYLLAGIDIFFLISFSVKDMEDLKEILTPLFISGIILCGIGFVQNNISGNIASAVYRDGIAFGEILMLIFPFCFAYTMDNKDRKRKFFYSSVLFIMFLNVIMLTQSKAALIGFMVEVFVLILTDIKFLPFIIILMPLGLNSIIDNIRQTWYATTSYGNVFNNIINLSAKIWNSGFGVDRKFLMSFYNSESFRTASETSFLSIPFINVSPVYINFVIDIGAIFLVLFLAYILKLAHSSLIMYFTGEKKYKRFFAAGLATLVAVSVSSFFETTIFLSRTMLIYWVMLGILRSVRIMNLGVYES